MRDAPTRMEITPDLIDMGDRIIRLDQVTSTRVGTVHPLRHAARLPLFAAIILTAANVVRGGGPVVDGLSAAALLGFLLALALFLYRIQRLVIATSDGEKVLIPGRDPAFLRLVLDRIRHAMVSSDPALRCVVDLTAYAIETGETAAHAEGALPTLRATADEMPASAMARRPEPELPPTLNGHSSGHARDTLAAPFDNLSSSRTSFADHRLEALERGPRAVPVAAAPEPSPQASIEAVIMLIDRATLPHKSEIRALLDPVRDHFTGGRTGRSDARHNWKLFHDYARKYLTDVEGLTDACEQLDGTLR